MMPNKFNKMLWVKRGGYVIVEGGMNASAADSQPQPGRPLQGQLQGQGAAAAGENGGKVTGTIVAVLYADHIKQLKKQGVW
jgi:hypothetical protein